MAKKKTVTRKDKIDYSTINIPSEKTLDQYTYAERRAYLLRLILEIGHPSLLPKKQLADTFNIMPSMITQDLEAIRDGIRLWIGKDAELVTQAVYHKAISGHLKSQDIKDHKTAAELTKAWTDFLYKSGIREAAPDRIEHSGQPVIVNFTKTEYPSIEELEKTSETSPKAPDDK